MENDQIKVGYAPPVTWITFLESGKNYEFLDTTNDNNDLPDILSIIYPYSDVIVDKYEENAGNNTPLVGLLQLPFTLQYSLNLPNIVFSTYSK